MEHGGYGRGGGVVGNIGVNGVRDYSKLNAANPECFFGKIEGNHDLIFATQKKTYVSKFNHFRT